jgi:lysozyme
MTPDNRRLLRNLLVSDEAYRQHPYLDSTGHTTIGIGRNLTDRGISYEEALDLLDNDIIYFSNRLNHNFEFFGELDDCRKIVLINMCFNLGIGGLLGFKRMLRALQLCDYDAASKEMIDSTWSIQVKGRATRLARMMQTGELE